jgi:hypothetical protein
MSGAKPLAPDSASGVLTARRTFDPVAALCCNTIVPACERSFVVVVLGDMISASIALSKMHEGTAVARTSSDVPFSLHAEVGSIHLYELFDSQGRRACQSFDNVIGAREDAVEIVLRNRADVLDQSRA